MSKPKIYIETTVPNFFFDFKNQSTEKRKLFRDYNIAQGFFVTEITTPQELNYQT